MSFKDCVFKALKKVPKGKVTTYKALAAAAGKPLAARAVGRILNSNPRPIKIPCHRVIKSDCSLGGYSSGVRKKADLLRKEGIKIKSGKIEKRFII